MSAWLQVRRQTGKESWQLLSAKSYYPSQGFKMTRQRLQHVGAKAVRKLQKKLWNFGLKLYHSLGECGHPGKPPFFADPSAKTMSDCSRGEGMIWKVGSFQPPSLDFMCKGPQINLLSTSQSALFKSATNFEDWHSSLYSLCPAKIKFLELWSFWSHGSYRFALCKNMNHILGFLSCKARYSQVQILRNRQRGGKDWFGVKTQIIKSPSVDNACFCLTLFDVKAVEMHDTIW